MCVGGSCVCHGGPVVLAAVFAMLIVVFYEFGGVFTPGVWSCSFVHGNRVYVGSAQHFTYDSVGGRLFRESASQIGL